MIAVLEREVSAFDASRIDEIRSSLESCFIEISSDAQALEVYKELAQLEGKNITEVLIYPKIIAQKLTLASEFQKQASSYHDIVDIYLEQLEQNANANDDELTLIKQKAIENIQNARLSRTRCLTVLTEVINEYWNYLTIESQTEFKHWAKSLLEKTREWAKEYSVKEGSEELRLAYLDFIAAIIKADELNSSKPKLRKAKVEQKPEKESEYQQLSSEEENLLDRLNEFNSGSLRNTNFSYY